MDFVDCLLDEMHFIKHVKRNPFMQAMDMASS